jgi:Putative peptidoglycan binding domain/N-acetylmuramoyl-L-alanine amidase
MQTLKLNSSNHSVRVLQTLLKNTGKTIAIDGDFGPKTLEQVKLFQREHQLRADGIVGPTTWATLFQHGYIFSTNITDWLSSDRQVFLPKEEYFQEIQPKESIFLHHTAGFHDPRGVIKWWSIDDNPTTPRRVGTAFVIGGPSLDGDAALDGKIYRAFMEYHWAHHLGMGVKTSGKALAKLNAKVSGSSIGIEICAIGPVQKAADGSFFVQFPPNPKKYLVPADQVCTLEKPFRKALHYHRYSAAQIEACRKLILSMAWFFNIPIPERTYDAQWFEFNSRAAYDPGLWTHTNVRTEKSDCFPQPEFIAMLNRLHEDFKTFDPHNLPRDRGGEAMEFDGATIKNYASDMNDFDDMIK